MLVAIHCEIVCGIGTRSDTANPRKTVMSLLQWPHRSYRRRDRDAEAWGVRVTTRGVLKSVSLSCVGVNK